MGVSLWDEAKDLETLKICSVSAIFNSKLYSLKRTFVFNVDTSSPHSDMLLLSSKKLTEGLSEEEKQFFGFVLDDEVEP